jgi:protein SPT2
MSFAALMALSASQTKESQSAVQIALLQRQRNEELQRKKREESDRKEREEAAKLRQKRFDDEKKQRELQLKRETEMRRMEEEQARREEEQRNALVYGPKKTKSGSKWPTSSGISKEVRKRRSPSDEENGSSSGSPAMALTREEKRQRRVEYEMRRGYAFKRAATSSGYSKAGRRLPGGAIDATSAPTSDSCNNSQSVKARLAALPNTLTKLNVHKRDTRTIDEILQDRAKAKTATLDGDDAKEFNDWFGKGKKDTGKTSTQVSTAAPSRASSSSNSPGPSASRSVNSGASKTSITPKSAVLSFSKTSQSKGADTSQSLKTEVKPKSTATFPPSMKSQACKPSSAARSAGPTKKRPRSPSSSLSPPPPKRRPASAEVESYSSEIWKLFGKDRSKYVQQDVYSDDEDMEVGAGVLEREELRSARLAKKEDEAALEQEKRHEEEKRRKKKEREMKERRG